jgi:hypothetical protein
LVFLVEILMLVCVRDYSSKSIAKYLGRKSWASISKLFCNVDPFIWTLSGCTDQLYSPPVHCCKCDDLSGAIWVGTRNPAIWSMLLWTWWRFYDHPAWGYYEHFLRPQCGTAFKHPPMPHTRHSCSWG